MLSGSLFFKGGTNPYPLLFNRFITCI